MKKLVLILSLFAASASAQEATLQTPVARPSEAKLRVQEISINAAQASVAIEVRDSAEGVIRSFVVVDTDSSAMVTAMNTVLGGEVGGILRRTNYRILNRLSVAGLISGVTLVP